MDLMCEHTIYETATLSKLKPCTFFTFERHFSVWSSACVSVAWSMNTIIMSRNCSPYYTTLPENRFKIGSKQALNRFEKALTVKGNKEILT